MTASSPRRLFALPLGVQQLGLIIGALIVAQLVTLALTVFLPPAPVQRWNLEKVAQSLLGEGDDTMLERRRMAGPPDLSSGGWLVSESSREALAKRLGRPTNEVVLAFYTQLPVGGAAVPVNEPRARLSEAEAGSNGVSAALLDTLIGVAHAQGGPPGAPPPGGMPGGGFPGGGFPGGGPPGGMPGGGVPGRSGPAPGGAAPGGGPGGSPPPVQQPGGGAPVAGAQGPASPGQVPTVGQPPAAAAPLLAPPAVFPPLTTPVVAPPAREPRDETAGRTVAPEAPATRVTSEAPLGSASPTASAAAAAPIPASPASPAAQPLPPVGTPQPIPFRENQGALSFTTPPFIEGDFIAAMRHADGSWIAVAPKAEPFPNSWQRRVMLWFALSLLVVTPLVWLFTRRLVKPLEGFARAAELLGRDPAASVMPLSGPAEIGRAARAFNQMRNRLRAFVDDRTAMVGAISHDLRTPLTRMRFRLEDVPDEQREELLGDVDEMELMIDQVIAFIRDASTPGARERIDLADLVQSTVGNARLTGGDIEIEAMDHMAVEVDPVGIRRLLANLLENALKYGVRARVRVKREDDIAVAEIIDDGPGIPEDERERAFEPFFRCEEVRESETPGSGLGLAVCRSIARSHGGDVRFEQREDGFVASLVLPTADDSRLPKAA